MRITAFLLVFLLFGCKKDSASFDVVSLIGTWNSDSGDKIQRWTFDGQYLYVTNDTIANCRAVVGQPSTYRIEKDQLVIQYVGIVNAMITPPKPIHYTIELLSSEKLILSYLTHRVDLGKCK